MDFIKDVKSLPQDVVAEICVGSKSIGQIHGRSFKYTDTPLSSGSPQVTNGLGDDGLLWGVLTYLDLFLSSSKGVCCWYLGVCWARSTSALTWCSQSLVCH